MMHGLDTGFLLAAELQEHPDHSAAKAKLSAYISSGDTIAIAPHIVTEFLHVATDTRRLKHALTMSEALRISQQWWTAVEVTHVFPDESSIQLFMTWMNQYSLGRKRLHDTLLAAIFRTAGINSILTTNPSDFTIFGGFTCITP